MLHREITVSAQYPPFYEVMQSKREALQPITGRLFVFTLQKVGLLRIIRLSKL